MQVGCAITQHHNSDGYVMQSKKDSSDFFRIRYALMKMFEMKWKLLDKLNSAAQ